MRLSFFSIHAKEKTTSYQPIATFERDSDVRVVAGRLWQTDDSAVVDPFRKQMKARHGGDVETHAKMDRQSDRQRNRQMERWMDGQSDKKSKYSQGCKAAD